MQAVDVEVDCGPGVACKLLHVTMDVSALETSTKPYMGGFKHKHAGTVYHHASIQTAQGQGQHRNGHKQRSGVQQDVADAGEKLTRETQTINETSCSCQTVREAATQMVAPGLLLDCSGDRYVVLLMHARMHVWQCCAELGLPRICAEPACYSLCCVSNLGILQQHNLQNQHGSVRCGLGPCLPSHDTVLKHRR